MPPNSSHYLGIDLAVDNLKAVVVDDQLELILVESVDFDSDIPEFQTRAGLLPSSGDTHLSPVELWIKALDILFDRLRSKTDLSRISAIGGSAIYAPIWLSNSYSSILSSLSSRPTLPLQSQLFVFSQSFFTLGHIPTPLDNTAHGHALALETALGGPDKMSARVGVTTHSGLFAAHIMRLREVQPDSWRRTAALGTPCSLLNALFSGEWTGGFGEHEALLSGLCSGGSARGAAGWDMATCEIVAGSSSDGARLREMLGTIRNGKSRATISNYWVERYGFDKATQIAPILPSFLSTYLSLAPNPSDCVLQFGHTDLLMAPTSKTTTHYPSSPLYILLPHPAPSDTSGKWIGVVATRNADVPRSLVRDMYTKSWSAFDRLVAIVPPGGSIGLDNKLFSFWILTSEGYPFTRNKGIHRFEMGSKVHEFRDLRANPRCLVESQLISLRVRFARLAGAGIFSPSAGTTHTTSPGSQKIATELGLGFNPYESHHLPKRILCTGLMAACGSVVNCLTDVFNASVFVPNSLLEESNSTSSVPSSTPPPISEQNPSSTQSSTADIPSRPALGGAYYARWLSKGHGANGEQSFEEDVRSILAERAKLKAGGNARGRSPRPGLGISANGSGSSTPIGLGSVGRAPSARSGLSAFMLSDEDEEEDHAEAKRAEEDFLLLGLGPGSERQRTLSLAGATNAHSTPNSTSFVSPGMTVSTAFTTPDLNLGINVGNSQNFTPVAPLEDVDNEGGGYLAKVAEPDNDSFLQYAAIVPEFCRLEGLVARGAV